MAIVEEEDSRAVRPNGLAIRGHRHARGWSPRDLIDAIGNAHEVATGVRASVAPALLAAVEERGVPIPYATLRLIAAGLDCNPVELLALPDDER